jgi:hypothetical protein
VGQGLFYGAALLDPLLELSNPLKRVTGPIRTFTTLLLAAVVGLRVFWVPARDLWGQAK